MSTHTQYHALYKDHSILITLDAYDTGYTLESVQVTLPDGVDLPMATPRTYGAMDLESAIEAGLAEGKAIIDN